MTKSVVVTVYNGEKFLEEQMQTILDQTVRPDEVLFSDDGSTDNSIEIINDFIKRNELASEWKIHINEQNKGYARNFLESALLTNGDIVFFCDQDDLWISDRIEVMSSMLSENPGINLLCTSHDVFYCEEDTRKWSTKSLADMKDDGTIDFPILEASNFHLKRAGCTMCIRREYLRQIMEYWVPGWAHDDFVWKMSVTSGSCAIFQYVSMKRRMHANNATAIHVRTREGRLQQLEDFDKQYSNVMSYASKIGATEGQLRVIEKNIRSVGIRRNLIRRKHLWAWINLFLNYKDCYPRAKGLYLDLYLTLFKKYSGVN